MADKGCTKGGMEAFSRQIGGLEEAAESLRNRVESGLAKVWPDNLCC